MSKFHPQHKSCHHPLNLLEFPHRIFHPCFYFFFLVFFFFLACVLLSPLHFLYWLNKWLMWIFPPVITTSKKMQVKLLFGMSSWFPITSLVPGASPASHRKKDHLSLKGSLVAQSVNNLTAMQETWVQSLGRENPLEKEIATHSSILAW